MTAAGAGDYTEPVTVEVTGSPSCKFFLFFFPGQFFFLGQFDVVVGA